MAGHALEITVDQHIARLVLQTGRTNSLSVEDWESCRQLAQRVEADADIASLVITGSGRAFCAGLNPAVLLQAGSVEEVTQLFDVFEAAFCALFSCAKPVVAAVNGHAIGGGLLLQLCADFVLCDEHEKIKMGLPELALGLALTPAIEALLAFNNLHGRRLSRLLYTGEFFSVAHAATLGLVDQLVSAEALLGAATARAGELGAFPAFQLNKRVLRENTARQMREQRQYRDNEAIFALLSQPAIREKLRSIVEA